MTAIEIIDQYAESKGWTDYNATPESSLGRVVQDAILNHLAPSEPRRQQAAAELDLARCTDDEETAHAVCLAWEAAALAEAVRRVRALAVPGGRYSVARHNRKTLAVIDEVVHFDDEDAACEYLILVDGDPADYANRTCSSFARVIDHEHPSS